MSEVLERVKAFCKRIGGKITELEASGYKVVSCILPVAKRISVLNLSGTIRLSSEDDGVTEEFEVGKVGFNIAAREPKHSIFEKALEDWGFSSFVLGDFNRMRVSYKEGELKVSLWRE
ncbi:MAG: hypothetical protein DRJ18_00970 [Candidatus Methanomethylicota archaeon]|nr:MAG: hypothetical protein DRJ18_00970 [Candidatus Verstraetearchaeota archaeon]